MAKVHSRTVLLRKALGAWKIYTAKHQKAQQQRQESKRKKARYLFLQAKATHHFFILRSAWYVWHCQLQQKRHQKHRLQIAESRYCTHLQRTTLRHWAAWAEFHKIRREQEKKQIAALQMLQRRRLFHRWKQRQIYVHRLSETCQMLQQQCARAAVHHSFEKWKQQLCWCRHLYDAEIRAHNHFETKLMIQVLRLWRGAIQIRKEFRDRSARCVREFQANMMRRSMIHLFARWFRNSQLARSKRMQMRIAELHHARELLRHSWLVLLRYSNLRSQKKLQQKSAQSFYDAALKLRAMRRWKSRNLERGRQSQQLGHALSRYYLSLKYRVFGAWHRYLQHHRQKRDEEREALDWRRQRLLKAGVSRWLQVGMSLRANRVFAAAEQDAQKEYDRYHLMQSLVQKWKRHRACGSKTISSVGDMFHESVERMHESDGTSAGCATAVNVVGMQGVENFGHTKCGMLSVPEDTTAHMGFSTVPLVKNANSSDRDLGRPLHAQTGGSECMGNYMPNVLTSASTTTSRLLPKRPALLYRETRTEGVTSNSQASEVIHGRPSVPPCVPAAESLSLMTRSVQPAATELLRASPASSTSAASPEHTLAAVLKTPGIEFAPGSPQSRSPLSPESTSPPPTSQAPCVLSSPVALVSMPGSYAPRYSHLAVCTTPAAEGDLQANVFPSGVPSSSQGLVVEAHNHQSLLQEIKEIQDALLIFATRRPQYIEQHRLMTEFHDCLHIPKGETIPSCEALKTYRSLGRRTTLDAHFKSEEELWEWYQGLVSAGLEYERQLQVVESLRDRIQHLTKQMHML